MTLYLCFALLAVGMLILFGNPLGAFIVGVSAVAGGFGYRLYVEEEVRAVVADVLFVATLLPVGWWAANQLMRIIDSSELTKND